MLAAKNFKRDCKRHRVTIFSLFFSLVLFICANSFCHYLERGVEYSRSGSQYDLSCFMREETDMETLYEELRQVKGVDRSTLVQQYYRRVRVTFEELDEEYRRNEYFDPNGYEMRDGFLCNFNYVDDDSYRVFLEENGCDPEKYMDPQNPQVLVLNRQTVMTNQNKTVIYRLLKESTQELYLVPDEEEEGSHDSSGLPVRIGGFLEAAPWFSSHDRYLQIFAPASFQLIWEKQIAPWSGTAYFLAEEHGQVYEQMKKICTGTNASVADNAVSRQETHALLTLIRVFTTGFLALISLIAAANVFNTISTNVLLRRREFAMLRSIGMTAKGLRAILNYECLLYGFKSLLYALPVSALGTWLIYRKVADSGYYTGFYIPWQTMAVAVSAVFLVVFASMLYAMKKLKTDDLAGELRDERS